MKKSPYSRILGPIGLSIALCFVHAAIGQSSFDRLTFPYSQWIGNIGGRQMAWHYAEAPVNNERFIKAPAPADWNNWYSSIVAYRQQVRGQLASHRHILKSVSLYPAAMPSVLNSLPGSCSCSRAKP